jgi:hypothetical protein
MTCIAKKSFGKLVFLALLGLSEAALTCMVLPEPFDWNGDELISRSRITILATAVNPESQINEVGDTVLEKNYLTLNIVEFLKGDSNELSRYLEVVSREPIDQYEVKRASVEHAYANHFSNHTDTEFWDKNMGRTPSNSAACGPVHSFVEGETYLIFIDALSAVKSAEIIRQSDDEWLVYVRQSLADQDELEMILATLIGLVLLVFVANNVARRRVISRS